MGQEGLTLVTVGAMPRVPDLMEAKSAVAGPTDLLTRAEGAYQAAVADPATAGPVAEAVVAEARRAGTSKLRWSPCARRPGALSARSWPRSVPGGCSTGQLGWPRAAGLDERLAEVLVVRSAVNEELGATRSAERDLLRARRLLGDKAPPALEQQTAVMHQNAGRIAEAAAIYRKTLRRRDLPVDIRAKMSNNLAMIEAQLGRYGVALALTGRARALAEEVGPFLTAFFAEGEAWVLAHAGRLPESLALFEESERLFKVAGLPLGELHAEAADVLLDLRLLPEARVAADRALREFIETGVPLMRAEAQLRVARVALFAGDAEAATEASRHAVEAFRRQRRTGWAARSAVVGVEARLVADTATHADLLEARRAAATLERLGLTVEAVDAHLAAGRTATRLGRDAWAEASFGRAHELARGRRCWLDCVAGSAPPPRPPSEASRRWPCGTVTKGWPTSTGTAASSPRPSSACSPRPTASSSARWRCGRCGGHRRR